MASSSVTALGLAFFIDLQDNTIPAPTWYIGCGTGSTPVTGAETALTAEVLPRVAVTPTQNTATSHDFLAQWSNSTGASVTIQEVGLFSEATGGVLIGIAVLDDGIAVPATMNFAAHIQIPITAVVA